MYRQPEGSRNQQRVTTVYPLFYAFARRWRNSEIHKSSQSPLILDPFFPNKFTYTFYSGSLRWLYGLDVKGLINSTEVKHKISFLLNDPLTKLSIWFCNDCTIIVLIFIFLIGLI